MSVRRDLSFETRQRCRLADGSAGAGAGAARRTHAECYQPRQSGGRAAGWWAGGAAALGSINMGSREHTERRRRHGCVARGRRIWRHVGVPFGGGGWRARALGSRSRCLTASRLTLTTDTTGKLFAFRFFREFARFSQRGGNESNSNTHRSSAYGGFLDTALRYIRYTRAQQPGAFQY